MKFSLAILALAHAKTYEERIVDNLNDCGFFGDEEVLWLCSNELNNFSVSNHVRIDFNMLWNSIPMTSNGQKIRNI